VLHIPCSLCQKSSFVVPRRLATGVRGTMILWGRFLLCTVCTMANSFQIHAVALHATALERDLRAAYSMFFMLEVYLQACVNSVFASCKHASENQCL
jgi:hypothetical protein